MVQLNTVVRGTNDKPVASRILAEYFESAEAPTGGELFVGYPITTAAEGKRPIDAVYVSPNYGVIVFDLVEGFDLGDFAERQDDAATRLEVRLKQHRELVSRRILQIPIHTVSFAPAVQRATAESDYLVANRESITSTLLSFGWPAADVEVYRRTVSALQSISGIRRTGVVRPATKVHSRGAKLKHLEESIATLDAQQSRAVIETASDVQRIRGLAGSGKTVVWH
jgi:superfamily I DNA and RNA helicase